MSDKKDASIIVIQDHAIKMFYNKLGPTWKKTIKSESKLIYQLDYYCYLHGINDPWYDYSDDPKYAYDSDSNSN